MGALCGELQNRMNLFARDAKFCDQFIHRHVFQVLEDGRNRRARAFKHPCAAPLAGDALDRGAFLPIKARHAVLSFLLGFITLDGVP